MPEQSDEAQCEVRTDQIKWKLFKTEEEAKAAKKRLEAETGKRWSDVLHSAKGYYFGYNRAGELATMAVTMAGQYYKLNVELTAGYMLGRNWCECH